MSRVCGATGHAGEQRERGAVDVGVEQADARAALAQREREVDRDGALADTALAGGDGDHVRDAGQHVALRLGRARRGRAPARVRRHRDRDLGDAGQRADALARGLLELGLDRTGGRRQLDVERDARVVDAEVLDESEFDDAAPEVGIDDRSQRVENRALR